uniref:RRM domain-containing protein n=1 Tax=Neobodo designis TaxID=312471 RepID=A0A7S1M591_NEODS|mmetsp:Transcript_34099/g.105351  ORF Transcript_34099/g.105351 Transcript_34099/m.105351 type:complete len:440 (+) Transcript_34099:459-1778(+)|eukprot:CAMPEP_0174856788 /NCGR_PEP_ID=MMETSP1114-20130205/36216_1 /TAXON_ID=312471 /ORGANISM="Neobodo designis, Strain CCAP 1951/1" /LENGTH=439 /DNA_ID=CAMNT_0016091593 /DNA_START=459 /DNA_END=1778 /DNA_ORIENTATION=-
MSTFPSNQAGARGLQPHPGNPPPQRYEPPTTAPQPYQPASPWAVYGGHPNAAYAPAPGVPQQQHVQFVYVSNEATQNPPHAFSPPPHAQHQVPAALLAPGAASDIHPHAAPLPYHHHHSHNHNTLTPQPQLPQQQQQYYAPETAFSDAPPPLPAFTPGGDATPHTQYVSASASNTPPMGQQRPAFVISQHNTPPHPAGFFPVVSYTGEQVPQVAMPRPVAPYPAGGGDARRHHNQQPPQQRQQQHHYHQQHQGRAQAPPAPRATVKPPPKEEPECVEGDPLGPRQVIVNGIATATTEAAVRAAFERWCPGCVDRVNLPLRRSGHHRGYAFVYLSHRDVARRAIVEMTGDHTLASDARGDGIRVQWANQKTATGSTPISGSGAPNQTVSGSGSDGSPTLTPSPIDAPPPTAHTAAAPIDKGVPAPPVPVSSMDWSPLLGE